MNEDAKPKVTQRIADRNNPSDDKTNTNLSSEALFDDTESNFFSYLMFLMVITIIIYIVYHNKTKVLALVIEGRRGVAAIRGMAVDESTIQPNIENSIRI